MEVSTPPVTGTKPTPPPANPAATEPMITGARNHNYSVIPDYNGFSTGYSQGRRDALAAPSNADRASVASSPKPRTMSRTGEALRMIDKGWHEGSVGGAAFGAVQGLGNIIEKGFNDRAHNPASPKKNGMGYFGLVATIVGGVLGGAGQFGALLAGTMVKNSFKEMFNFVNPFKPGYKEAAKQGNEAVSKLSAMKAEIETIQKRAPEVEKEAETAARSAVEFADKAASYSKSGDYSNAGEMEGKAIGQKDLAEQKRAEAKKMNERLEELQQEVKFQAKIKEKAEDAKKEIPKTAGKAAKEAGKASHATEKAADRSEKLAGKIKTET